MSRPNRPTTLGEQELEALELIRLRAPISVGEMAKEFGTPRGLARTTVLTVMERLRSKGFLGRVMERGVYRYSPTEGNPESMKLAVAEFVRRSLGGSLGPFVSYLTESAELNQAEVAQLRQLVETLDDRTSEEPA